MVNSDEGMYGGCTYEEHLFIEFLRELYTLRILDGFVVGDLQMMERAGMYVP